MKYYLAIDLIAVVSIGIYSGDFRVTAGFALANIMMIVAATLFVIVVRELHPQRDEFDSEEAFQAVRRRPRWTAKVATTAFLVLTIWIGDIVFRHIPIIAAAQGWIRGHDPDNTTSYE